MDAESHTIIGELINDRYRVLAELGRGGMGAVYRVEHVMMKKELALKLLHPELGRLEDVARRFEREAEAAARLDHPNIISVTDFGRAANGMLFLVMELLSGPSLAQVIRPGGGPGKPLGVERSIHILKQILRALDKAHTAGVIHRDLKPENIVLVERDGDPDVVKLLDFGIAKLNRGESGEQGEALTQAGMIFGTPEYISPEQAMGEEADGRADLYAAGVMLYEMLTGRRPFESNSKLEVLSMHLTREPEPMRSVAPATEIPPSLEKVVSRAMAKKREERFADAAAFLLALEQASSRATARRTAVLSHLPALRTAVSSRLPALRTAVLRHLTSLLDRAGSSRLLRTGGVMRAIVVGGLVVVLGLLLRLAHVRETRHVQAPEPGPSADANRPVTGMLEGLFSRSALLDKLQKGKSCRDRKQAALSLIATGDAKYLDALKAARARRGGFLGLQAVNGCMFRELDAAIRKYEAAEK